MGSCSETNLNDVKVFNLAGRMLAVMRIQEVNKGMIIYGHHKFFFVNDNSEP